LQAVEAAALVGAAGAVRLEFVLPTIARTGDGGYLYSRVSGGRGTATAGTAMHGLRFVPPSSLVFESVSRVAVHADVVWELGPYGRGANAANGALAVTLDVAGASVALTVNGSALVAVGAAGHAAPLAGMVAECDPRTAASGCATLIGQLDGGGAAALAGSCMSAFAAVAPAAVDLLDPALTGDRTSQVQCAAAGLDGPGLDPVLAAGRTQFCFGGGGDDGIVVAGLTNRPLAAAGLNRGFAVGLELRLPAAATGYLVTRTTAADQRAFGLYLRPDGRLALYYAPTATATATGVRVRHRRALWEPQLARDGRLALVTLVVTQQSASVLVDGVSLGTVVLSGGGVRDCVDDGPGGVSSSTCVLLLGQRAPSAPVGADARPPSARAAAGFALTTGCLVSAVLHPFHTMVATAAAATATAVPAGGAVVADLLSSIAHGQAVSTSPRVCFPVAGGAVGSGGLLVGRAPPFGANFELTIAASVPPSQSGYLLARADRAGVRSLGLFLSAASPAGRELRLYYQLVGSSRQRQATLAAGIGVAADDELVVVQVTAVTRAGVTGLLTRVNGGAPVQTVLGGALRDCGDVSAGQCITWLGQRPPTPGATGAAAREGFLLAGSCLSEVVLATAVGV
jgi:hypothetical protein